MNIPITRNMYIAAVLLCALTAGTANVTHSYQQLPMDVAKLIATFSHEPTHVPLVGHTNCVSSVACSSNFNGTNGYIITGSDDKTAQVWRLRLNDQGELLPELVATLTGHTRRVSSVACSSSFDGTNGYIITGSSDKTAKVWRLRPNDQGELLPELVTTLSHTHLVTSVAFSSNFDGTNGYIITGSSGRTAQVWRLLPELVTTLTGHINRVSSVACSSNFDGTNGYIITGSWDKTAQVWRLRLNDQGELLPELVATLTGHTNRVSSVACSSNFDGTNGYIITGSWDHTAQVWRLRLNDQGELLPELVTTLTDHTFLINSVACSSNFDGTNGYIITGSCDNTALLWRLRLNDQGELLPEAVTTLAHTNWVSSVACSSNFDGKNSYIITGSRDNTAQVWRMGPDQGVVNALAAATLNQLACLRPTEPPQ